MTVKDLRVVVLAWWMIGWRNIVVGNEEFLTMTLLSTVTTKGKAWSAIYAS